MQKFRKAFGRLPDPRAANARYELLEVLFIALAAMLCGAESCSDMADFGQSKEGLLRLFLCLEHGIPSHDTFSRVFRLLKPQAFEFAFRRFMAAFAKANGLKLTGVVAVDGKALRGAYERGGKATPLHLVNVFAVDARMALAQQKASGRNETAGALEVLDLLSLEGCIVTADALHCTRAFAAAVRERGGDYVLAIKANRGRLFAAVTQLFARSGKRSTADQIDRSTHDRREARRATIMRNNSLAGLYDFPGAAAVGASPRADVCEVSPPMRPSYVTLCPFQIHLSRAAAPCHPQPLGHREPAPLGARRQFCRGCQPLALRPCSREPRHSPQTCPQHPANPPGSSFPAKKNQTRRLG
jgi:predicted transposase YbfD/YdcC